MPIRVNCSECDHSFRVRDSLAGKAIRCPECGDRVDVAGEDDDRPRRQRSSSRSRPSSSGRGTSKGSGRSKKRRGKKQSANSKPLIIGGAIAAVLVAGGITTAVLMTGGDSESGNSDTTTASTNTDTANPQMPMSDPNQSNPNPTGGVAPAPTQPTTQPPPSQGNSSLFPLSSIRIPTFKRPAQFQSLAGGVLVANLTATDQGTYPAGRMKLKVYLPPGNHAKGSLACVLIAPAGSPMIGGMDLGDGDSPEHLPYVKAGMAVVAYSLDGELDFERDNNIILRSKHVMFASTFAGMANARNAFHFALNELPEVDPKRIFTAGHSSAGATALLFAAQESRIRGCAAFAPASNVGSSVQNIINLAPEVEQLLPKLREFGRWSSPLTHAGRIKCPVFLFQAFDDQVTTMQETRAFAAALQRSGNSPTLRTVQTGGHYDPMVQQGIPQAIQWMKQLPSN